MKYIVISQPKAGTYLAANLLQALGLNFSHVHIDPGMYRVFKNNNLKNFDRYSGPLSKAIEAIPNQSFGVGHIPLNTANKDSMSGIKKILITRNRNDIRESAKRYAIEKGVSVHSIINDANLDNIEKWSKEPDVFTIRFEDIIGLNIGVVDSLQKFLFKEIRKDSLSSIKEAIDMDSLTKSSIR